jgi:hypothetical protein
METYTTRTPIRRHKENGLPLHDDGTQERVLGALPPTRNFALPNYSSMFGELAEDEWQERSVRDWNVTIYNQGSHGSCVGHGSITGFTYAWRISGQEDHVFSPTFVYALINGGQDKGAQVSSGLEALKDNGTCLFSEFGEDKIYATQIPEQAANTAKRFRVLEAYKINSWLQLGTAINNGMVVVSGIGVGNNFSQLDSNSVAPLPDAIVGGHCLAHVGLKKVSGIWVVETQNSWGANWGLGGFCYLRKEHWDPRYGFPFDAFAIGGVLDDPGEKGTDPIPLKSRGKK